MARGYHDVVNRGNPTHTKVTLPFIMASLGPSEFFLPVVGRT